MSDDTPQLAIGDVTLREESPGTVTVYEHGAEIGRITADGLLDAARLTDDQLNQAWVENGEVGP